MRGTGPIDLPTLAPSAGSGASGLPSVGEVIARNRIQILVLAVACAVIFYPTILQWVHQFMRVNWKGVASNDELSHRLLVPFVSGVIFYANRRSIARIPSEKSLAGVFLTVASLGVFALGYLCTINTLQQLGAFGSLIGLSTALLGWGPVRRHPFPFAFLVLTIPVPDNLYLPIKFHLHMLVTKLSAGVLFVSGTPVLDQGNHLVVGGKMLCVAQACSGIPSSLLPIVSVAILFGYLFSTGLFPGSLLVLIAVPVTIAVNILLIVSTVWLLHYYKFDLTRDPFHQLMGYILFSLSMALLYLGWKFVAWLFRVSPPAPREDDAQGPELIGGSGGSSMGRFTVAAFIFCALAAARVGYDMAYGPRDQDRPVSRAETRTANNSAWSIGMENHFPH